MGNPWSSFFRGRSKESLNRPKDLFKPVVYTSVIKVTTINGKLVEGTEEDKRKADKVVASMDKAFKKMEEAFDKMDEAFEEISKI